MIASEPLGEGAVMMTIGMLVVEDTFHSTTDDDDWIHRQSSEARQWKYDTQQIMSSEP